MSLIMAAKDEKNEAKKDKKISASVEKLVDEIAKLSVMELSSLVSALQNKLGVSAQAPVAVAAAAPAAEAKEKAGEEQAAGAKQTVVITDSGSNKIAVIRALRTINQNWTLKEAKDMTEEVADETGFKILTHRLDFFGICRDCTNNS